MRAGGRARAVRLLVSPSVWLLLGKTLRRRERDNIVRRADGEKEGEERNMQIGVKWRTDGRTTILPSASH